VRTLRIGTIARVAGWGWPPGRKVKATALAGLPVQTGLRCYESGLEEGDRSCAQASLWRYHLARRSQPMGWHSRPLPRRRSQGYPVCRVKRCSPGRGHPSCFQVSEFDVFKRTEEDATTEKIAHLAHALNIMMGLGCARPSIGGLKDGNFRKLNQLPTWLAR
jgi:hypothetical protein